MQPAFRHPEVGGVGNPWGVGLLDVERACQRVMSDRFAMTRVRRCSEASFAVDHKPVLTTDSRDSLLACSPTGSTWSSNYSASSVASAIGVQRDDLFGELLVSCRPSAWTTLAPRVKTTLGHRNQATHHGDREACLLHCNERELAHCVSFAKEAAAFLKNAFSFSKCLRRFRIALIVSRSAVVIMPIACGFASVSACFTHCRTDPLERSSSLCDRAIAISARSKNIGSRFVGEHSTFSSVHVLGPLLTMAYGNCPKMSEHSNR